MPGPADIAADVFEVLATVERDEKGLRTYLTVPQILERLEAREQLVATAGCAAAEAIVRETLLQHLCGELHFDFVEVEGPSLSCGGMSLGEVYAVFRLRG